LSSPGKCNCRPSKREAAGCERDSSSANPDSFPDGKGPKGWRADFDRFISNERNVVRVLEGKYDHNERAGSGSNHVSAFEKLRQELVAAYRSEPSELTTKRYFKSTGMLPIESGAVGTTFRSSCSSLPTIPQHCRVVRNACELRHQTEIKANSEWLTKICEEGRRMQNKGSMV